MHIADPRRYRLHPYTSGQLTIEALADEAGLHPTYLSDIERGKANPSLAKLGALASVFEMRVSALVAAAEEASEPTVGHGAF